MPLTDQKLITMHTIKIMNKCIFGSKTFLVMQTESLCWLDSIMLQNLTISSDHSFLLVVSWYVILFYLPCAIFVFHSYSILLRLLAKSFSRFVKKIILKLDFVLL